MSEPLELHSQETARSGPAILLLHGLNESLDAYQPIMEGLAADHHLLAVDLRGHGESDWQTPYRIPDYAADVLRFLDVQSISSAILAGHSLGGLVATYLAVHEPDRVRGLFLEDPPFFSAQMPGLKQTGFYEVFVFVRELMRQHRAADGTVDSMELIVAQLTTETPDGEVVALTSLYGAEYLSRLAVELHSGDPRTLDYVLDGSLFEGFSPEQDLPRISCPTRLIAGEFDHGGALTAHDVERVVDLIPDCTHSVWNGIGHDLHHLRPGEYARELQLFARALGN